MKVTVKGDQAMAKKQKAKTGSIKDRRVKNGAPKSLIADKKKKAARTRALKNVKKAPRQQRLPTMVDSGIKALDNVGARYADIRDQRQTLTREEVSLKEHTKVLMHKHGKTSYVTEALEIHLTPGDENVSVKVKDASKAKIRTTAEDNSEPLEDSGVGSDGSVSASELAADE